MAYSYGDYAVPERNGKLVLVPMTSQMKKNVIEYKWLYLSLEERSNENKNCEN